jgi:putative molybdopterin biosynthesis protein
MTKMMTTKEVARYLNVNEKMVYALIADKGLPATKVTGKWLFPEHLVEQWLENNAINFPDIASPLTQHQGLLVLAGSNDILLDRVIGLYNETHRDHLAVFANLGSMGGIRALRRQQCHVATSHLLQEDDQDYNFDVANRELDSMPVVVNFCRREQGLMVAGDNPLNIRGVCDLGAPGLRIANRPLGTGTRLLLDRELERCGIRGEQLAGYDSVHARHMDAGLEVLAGRVDVAPGIRPVAHLLGLAFVSLRWERYDLLIAKDNFFEKGIQSFLGLLHAPAFHAMADQLVGYDLQTSGQMLFQR